MIPWVAGGFGNYRLVGHDRTKIAYPCQDGAALQEPNQLPAKTYGPDGTFDHGLADVIINQIAVEQQNTVTDPLLDGWQDRTGVHQLFPLLVHACLFGGGYGARAGPTAARYL